MKGYTLLAVLSALMAVLLASGCKREEKATGPEPTLPEGGTQLMFADCDPFGFNHQIGLQQSATLVADSRYACSGTVQFLVGDSASWISGGFHVPAGSYREGFHLVLERDLNNATTPAIFAILFRGIASQFTVIDTMPAGSGGDALRQVIEIGQTGTIGASDSLRPVSLTVMDLSGSASVNLNANANGSFIKVGVDPVALCQFRILYDTQDGITRVRNHAFDLIYDYPYGGIADSVFLDFTHGSRMESNHRLQMGDQFGVAYVASESGGCRDTAAFWGLPPTQPFRVDVIRNDFALGNIVSDGQFVWFWDIQATPQDSFHCGFVRVNRDSILGTPLVHRPIRNCSAPINVQYDRSTNLIWVIQQGTGADTAWGYDHSGVLDTTVLISNAPGNAHLYRGYWVQQTGRDLLRRTIVEIPFAGGTDLPPQTYAAEITEDFAGGAGIGLPGAGRTQSWSVNAFDANGNWIAQYAIESPDPAQQLLLSVSILTADSLIAYAIQWEILPPHARFQEVRVLSPN